MATKSETDRIQESIEIRKQLSKLGATLCDTAKKRLSKSTNDYIKTGEAQTVSLRIDERHNVRILLTPNENKKSGITLEKI